MKPKRILDLEKELNINFDEEKNFLNFDTRKNTFIIDNNGKIKALKIKEEEGLCLQIVKFLLFDLQSLESLVVKSTIDLSFLTYCTNLKELRVKVNSDQNLFYVSKVLTLENLSIEFFGVKNIILLENLTSLKSLVISNNIEDILFIKNLININELTILFPSTLLDISPISSLIKLNFLYIDGDLNIEKVHAIENLINLKLLILYNCIIENSSCFKNLINLKTLYLRNNNIYDLYFLKEFKKLKELRIENNSIDNIFVLGELFDLEDVRINYTELVDISVLANLRKLKIVDLQNNKISDITDLLKNPSISRVNLKGNKKIEIDFPKEVLEAGWDALKEFSLESRENIIFRNVKVLLLGNPNIGKSNLLEFLETNIKPNINETTHGVKYKLIKFNDVNFHFWDFGGQEYFHATHQLFFSQNAINLVLWGQDVQRGNIIETCFKLDYWLRIITQLNHNSNEIVLLTENKIDLNIPKYSEKLIPSIYYETFKNLKFYESHISLIEMKNLIGFREKVSTISEEVINKFKYPKFYEVFWKRIQMSNQDYVTIDEINNRSNNKNVLNAIKVFHNMGMLLYFSKIIPDKVFHKPQLLLDLLYHKVLYSEMKFIISKNEIKESILDNSLGLTDEEIIKLLKNFNLVFEIDNEKDTYFIPQYLPLQTKSQQTIEVIGFSICNIKIQADHYLMSLAMLKIFSKFGNYVDKDKEEYLFWQNGIIILKDKQHLLIKYNVHNQTIELYSAKDCNKSLQKEVVDFILDLPEDYTFPKRNFENHIVKRWIDVLDESDPDFSPHFSQRLEEYPEYHQEFLNRNWNPKYQWKSNFFNVLVSVDGLFFIKWENLKNDENLTEINFENSIGEKKKYTEKDYYFWIDKEIDMKNEKSEKEGNAYYFNGPVNAGNIGNNGYVENFNIPEKSSSENKNSVFLSETELNAIKRWKKMANITFYLSLAVTACLVCIYVNEYNFIMNHDQWVKLKEGDWVKWIGLCVGFLWNSVIGKIWYDRNWDSSKEKAFIELYKIKK